MSADTAPMPAVPSPVDLLLASLGMPSMGELLADMTPAIDPDAVTLDDLYAAIVELREQLAPVVELANVAKANAGKLARFGIRW